MNKLNTNQKIKINTIFIHDGDNVLTKKGIELLNKLKKLKKNKKIMKVGLSIHKYENLLNIINKVSFIDFHIFCSKAKLFKIER